MFSEEVGHPESVLIVFKTTMLVKKITIIRLNWVAFIYLDKIYIKLFA